MFSVIDQLSCLGDSVIVNLWLRNISSNEINARWQIVGHSSLRILCEIENYRPGATTRCDIESPSHSPSHIGSRTNLITPFGDRLSDANKIYFLEGIHTESSSTYLAGNNHNRSTIYHGISNTSHSISGTRPTCHQADTDLTRRTGKALSSMCGSLFVAHQNMMSQNR